MNAVTPLMIDALKIVVKMNEPVEIGGYTSAGDREHSVKIHGGVAARLVQHGLARYVGQRKRLIEVTIEGAALVERQGVLFSVKTAIATYEWEPLEAYLRRRWPEAFEEHHHAAGTSAKVDDRRFTPEHMPKPRPFELIGLNNVSFHRYRKAGELSERVADRVATELGLHPSDIWPNWWQNS